MAGRSGPMTRVTVIIVNWNGRDVLARSLTALDAQVFNSFETIVVDNGSRDGSIEMVETRFPHVRLICLPINRGFSAANNIAMRLVETEYVALLNNDTIPDPHWLSNLISSMDQHPEAGLAASKMVLEKDPAYIDRAGDAYTIAGAGLLRGRGISAKTYSDQEWVFGASAGAALYRMQMLRDIGLFDEDFFILYEDVDLSFRAQLMGYRCLYIPKAIVQHQTTLSIGHDSTKSVYYSHRNLEWTYLQNMPSQLIWKTLLPHLVYILAALFYFTSIGRGRAYLKAKWDALKGAKRALKKRRKIQRHKKVDDYYIQGLLETELFFSRYIRRLKQPTGGKAPSGEVNRI